MRRNCYAAGAVIGASKTGSTTSAMCEFWRRRQSHSHRLYPQVLAAVRNAAIGLLRFWNNANIAATFRANAYQATRLFSIFSKLGILQKSKALEQL